TPEKAMELIELVANNQYMFTSDRSMKRGIMEVDTMDAILAQNKAMAQQIITLNKKMEKLEVATIGRSTNGANQLYGQLRSEILADSQTPTGKCTGSYQVIKVSKSYLPTRIKELINN
ncbi:hypothetical protein PIB30_111987, partial [Stylosanthes scabra]|nr:hypothetical protein [Stylosanthes scabra]